MMKHKGFSHQGFTLMEVLVSVAIAGLVISAACADKIKRN